MRDKPRQSTCISSMRGVVGSLSTALGLEAMVIRAMVLGKLSDRGLRVLAEIQRRLK